MASADDGGEWIDFWVNAPLPVVDRDIFAGAAERAAREIISLRSGGLYAQNGTSRQRDAVAMWLARSGVSLAPDALLLCAGAQQSIHLAFADIARLGPLIASESQTYTGALAAARDLGIAWQGVAHDAEGMLPEELDRILASTGCRAIFTTPVCQNPLGFETGAQRRREILEVCSARDAYIVEDDIYGIYAGKERFTYKQLAPERVYYLSSLSKCLTPLLRTGVIAPPAERQAALAEALRAQGAGAGPLSLQTACELIESEADLRAASLLREEALWRCDLAQHLLGLEALPMPGGSPHIWIPLPGEEARSLTARAREQGVLVLPPDSTSIAQGGAEGIRLAILAPPRREDAEKGLAIIARLLGK